ncbi:MAG: SDR family oxidoreductase [Deltaproteobacteria bacterium]|jgi:3-oxoacyl-[acyl-carrier protein] reductase|nr:SDR family oxidoreductase [Deltaproteobacteria bacterium]
MRIDFSGKSVIVTGAGGGIGRASAMLFARLGASVVASDVNPVGLQETIDEIQSEGGAVASKVSDVTDPDQAAGIVRFACAEFGRVDVLFNNAGGSFPTPMESIDREEFARLRSLNFDAVYHASMEALPGMVEAGGGVILSTTSGAGTGAVNGLAVYGAAKAGVNSLMRSIAVEYGKRGIRANAIAPSAASPGMIEWLKTLPGGVEGYAAKQPMGRMGTPEDIASVAAFLASEHAGFINGVVLPVDGGIEAMLAVPA